MDIIDHASQPLDEWRPGVMTRMLVSALTGAGHLCVFEQFCEPGRGAPTHRHKVEVCRAASRRPPSWPSRVRGGAPRPTSIHPNATRSTSARPARAASPARPPARHRRRARRGRGRSPARAAG